MIHYHSYIGEDGEFYTEADPFCLPAVNADSDFNQEGYLPSIDECLDFSEDGEDEDREYPDTEPGTAWTLDCY